MELLFNQHTHSHTHTHTHTYIYIYIYIYIHIYIYTHSNIYAIKMDHFIVFEHNLTLKLFKSIHP